MRAEYVIAITLVAIVVAAALTGVVMGPEWRVSVSGQIAAPPQKVIAYLADFHNWRDWSVWNKQHFPKSVFAYRGASHGVGAEQVWKTGPTTTVWHIRRVESARLTYQRQTNAGPVRHGRFEAKARAGGSRLTWTVSGNSGLNPFDRLIAWFYSGRIRHQLHAGLQGIQRHFRAPQKSS